MTDKNVNVERIESFLSVLHDNVKLLESAAKDKMRDFSLVVSDADERLQEAHELQWPTEELGDRGKYISFDYYQAMSSRNSGSAQYITRRYEEAARDMTGNDFIDILFLLEAMKQEAQLIEVFLSQKERFTGSSLEQEVLSNFQLWIQTALNHTKQIHKDFIQNSDTPQEKSKTLSPDEARRNQAVFKVKLNGHNDLIISAEDTLSRGFLDTAPVFYSKFLSAGLNANNLSEGRFESQLKAFIEDQKRRLRLYRHKAQEILDEIKSRRAARQSIWELSEVGKPMPVDGPGVMVRNAETTPEEKTHWNEVVNTQEESPPLIGRHRDFPDLEEGDPHSQYLLRSGGTVTGDIGVEEGKTIDGVDVSEHRHMGADGSPQIHGDSIIKGTLKEEAVNTEKLPTKPENLTVSRMDLNMVPPGLTVIDTFLEWDGDDNFAHEIEVRRVKIPVIEPVGPTLLSVSSVSHIGEPVEIDPVADLLYVGYAAGSGYISIFDVSDPLSVEHLATISPGNNIRQIAHDPSRSYIYFVATGSTLLHVWDVSDPSNSFLVSNDISLTFGGGLCYDDARQLAFAEDRVVSFDKGLRVIDLADPNNPVLRGLSPKVSTLSFCRNLVYDSAQQVVFWPDAPDGTLAAFDVSDPDAPFETGAISSSFPYAPNAVALDDSRQLLYVADRGRDMLQIVDVSNPSDMSVVSELSSVGVIEGPQSVAYQSSTQRVFMSDDSFPDGIHVIDVSDPENPSIIETIDQNEIPELANAYWLELGDHLYLSTAKGPPSDLLIFDVGT